MTSGGAKRRPFFLKKAFLLPLFLGSALIFGEDESAKLIILLREHGAIGSYKASLGGRIFFTQISASFTLFFEGSNEKKTYRQHGRFGTHGFITCRQCGAS